MNQNPGPHIPYQPETGAQNRYVPPMGSHLPPAIPGYPNLDSGIYAPPVQFQPSGDPSVRVDINEPAVMKINYEGEGDNTPRFSEKPLKGKLVIIGFHLFVLLMFLAAVVHIFHYFFHGLKIIILVKDLLYLAISILGLLTAYQAFKRASIIYVSKLLDLLIYGLLLCAVNTQLELLLFGRQGLEMMPTRTLFIFVGIVLTDFYRREMTELKTAGPQLETI